jgi:putative ABC transport system ATP-binding protein
VVFDGRELTRCSDTELARIRRRIGYVFQDFGLVRGLTALDNVIYPLIPRGLRRGERDATARELLERLGIEHCSEKRPGQLSGGEQQRVAVARALAGKPDLLLADEPTSNLDAKAAHQFLAILRDIRATGTTVVLASHDPALIDLANPVFRLDGGRVVGVDEGRG